jgi:TRAP-type C4-dicarboxylate transport system permease small subunit
VKSLVSWVNGIVDVLLVAALVVIATVLVVQVFLRYLLHAALPWPEELSQFLLIFISFLGMFRAFGKDQHIRMSWLPEEHRAVRLLKAAGLLMVAGFLLYVGFGGWKLAMGAWHQPSTALRLPMAIPYLIVPLACVLSVLAVIGSIRTLITAPSGAKDAP